MLDMYLQCWTVQSERGANSKAQLLLIAVEYYG